MQTRLEQVGRSTQLSQVGRDYENPDHLAYRTVERDPWEWGRHMLPNEEDELLVQAACQRHYAWQQQSAMKAGVTAACVNPKCNGRP